MLYDIVVETLLNLSEKLVCMKSGDFVLLDYVGRVKDTREIFDLTKEDVAKSEKIFDEKFKYKPVVAIVDGGFMIKGLNEAVKTMNIGEKKNVVVEVKDAFGERSANLIRIIPSANFRNQNIDATPGSYVTINNLRGKIVSSDGGRIRVDFNHPLAGKTLEYEVEVLKEVSEMNEKVKSILQYFMHAGDEDVVVNAGETTEIVLTEKVDMPKNAKHEVAETIMKWMKEIKKVKFVDVFEE